MRNRALHDQLRAFAGHAGRHLTGLVDSGLEIPFEVTESPGRTSVLYHYRPLSDQFVRERFAELRRLDGFSPAVLALSQVEGLSGYLRALGVRSVPTSERDRAEEALRELFARAWEEVTAFDLESSHFERAYRQLESVLYENTVVTTVLTPVIGVRIEAERLDLGTGLALARGDLCEAPPEAVWAGGHEGDEPNALALLTVEARPQEPPPLAAARLAFKALVTSLRLFRAGPATLGPVAWWRLDDGPWQTLELAHAAHPRAGQYRLRPADRQELAELLELVRSRPLRGGSLPWALARFEAGCERLLPIEGLSDHLLAVRALLDGEGAGPADIPSRLAALCAEPEDRALLETRVQRAFLLERLVMRGELDGRSLGAIGGDQPDAIARDLEAQLRAILRDMVCGYLDSDVKRIADELLMAESAARPEPRIEARRAEPRATRDSTARAAKAARKRSPAAPPPDDARDTVREAAREAARDPAGEAAESPTQETVAVGGFDWHREADWGLDDDPADFTAAV